MKKKNLLALPFSRQWRQREDGVLLVIVENGGKQGPPVQALIP